MAVIWRMWGIILPFFLALDDLGFLDWDAPEKEGARAARIENMGKGMD